jgi:hypothetical protein
MRPRGKRRRAIGTVLLIMFSLGTAAGVSGCAPEEGTISSPPPSPTSATSTPVLPSNEEALAIVEELVPKFLAAEARAVQNGDYLELEVLASKSYVDTVREGAAELEAKGHRLVGQPAVSGFVVQSVQADEGAVVITSYACQDISAVDIVDTAGNNVQPPGLADHTTMVYGLNRTDKNFVIEEVEAWSGEGSC